MARRGRGEGSIFQRSSDNLWVAVLDLGIVDGKRRRLTFYGKTKREAREKLEAAKAKLVRGLPVEPERETVATFLERWLETTARPSLAPRTYESYRMIIFRHLIPALGRIRLVQLTPFDVQGYLNAKLAAGLSPRTVAYHRAVLRAALNDALSWGLVARNVAALADPPKQVKRERRYLSPGEAQRLLESIAGHKLEPLVVTALGLGLRLGELLGLRWEDIDEAAGVVYPRYQVQRIRGQGLVLRELKTRTSARPIPLPAVVAEALRRQRARVAEMRLAAGPAWREHGLVFPSSVGTPREPRAVAREWHELRRAIGMEWLNLHGLRHGLAALLAARGVHPRVAMEILRHSQFSLTMEVYTAVAPELTRQAAAEIDAALARVPSQRGASLGR
ncbi:MAG: tyrosine-type recombinase/integrase [Thermomicrobium sp.]|nr:tyrosine-type recombinase/integrase [Thermomicrobium sp.]